MKMTNDASFKICNTNIVISGNYTNKEHCNNSRVLIKTLELNQCNKPNNY